MWIVAGQQDAARSAYVADVALYEKRLSQYVMVSVGNADTTEAWCADMLGWTDERAPALLAAAPDTEVRMVVDRYIPLSTERSAATHVYCATGLSQVDVAKRSPADQMRSEFAALGIEVPDPETFACDGEVLAYRNELRARLNMGPDNSCG